MNIDWRTYLITQADLSAGRTTPEIVAAAIEGGVGVVQLREKHATVRERLRVGREVRSLTADARVPFVVNDRVDLALALDADGVHLGDDDLPVAAARDLLGDDAIVGRSVSSVAGAERAEATGADYLGVGAVFPTESKNVTSEQAERGVETVRRVADAVDLPLVGVGGITPENADEVAAAGADGAAVITAITAADHPAAATRALREAVDAGRATGADDAASTGTERGDGR
ncbi:thiamine phosphate synthase [Halegenticoccus tardaugens]|uniref:thiamine phosphate synthase n=1 Tax=Halegenticoccus tardaugens TaxID=2071624 RepID=UPI00100C2FB4|nr:thiamine phosphate synthase [Halegenticoccus tardaugens]